MKSRPPIPDLVRDQVRQGRRVRLVVGGWSMVPLVWPGSRVEIAPTTIEDLRPGDLVAVASGGHVVCHLVRAIGRDKDGPLLRSRGVATGRDDPPARASDVLGRVERVQWGPCSVRTDGTFFRVSRHASARVGPVLRRLRLAYLRARAVVGPAPDGRGEATR